MKKPRMKFVSVIKQSKNSGTILDIQFFEYNDKIVVCKIHEGDCYYEDNKIISVSPPRFIYEGKAKLHPEDTYDLKLGMRLAFDAAMEKRATRQTIFAKQISKNIMKDIPKIDFIVEKSFISKLNNKIKKGKIK